MTKQMINIGAGLETSGLKTGADDAVKLIESAGKKMQETSNEVATKTEKSFSNLRQAYRATAKDAYEIALQQGTTSAAFREAIDTAGSYKDELDQVNNSISVLSSDTPILTGALGLGQGLAGAFSTATGAMALFGEESEDVQKALLKVQAAMALTQGLQAVGQLGDAFSSFADVIDVKVLPALNAVKAAVISNPIGLVVGAVVGLSLAYAALADNTDRAANAERNYVEINYNASATIQAQTEKIKEQNKELLIQANAKLKGISVEKERVNIAATENKKLQESLELLKQNTKFEDVSNDQTLLNNINKKNQILQIENQIQANKDLIDAYKEKIKLEAIINQKEGGKNSTPNDIKAQVKFTPTIDTDAIENLDGLLVDAGDQLAQSLDGAMTPINAKLFETMQIFEDFKTSAEQALIQGAANAFVMFGTLAGQALAGANVSIEEAAGKLMGGLLTTIGSSMITAGIGMALGEPFFGGRSIGMIAGGTALVAAGSALGASAKASQGGANNTSFSPSNSNSGFTPSNTDSMSLSTRLVGTDLLLSVEKSNKRMERVR